MLFAKITPCMENGKAAVGTGSRNGLGCGTTELHVLAAVGGIAPLHSLFIHQRSFRRAAEANFTGTAVRLRVPVAFVEKAELPLAPLGEQRRIVAKLEKLLGKVDACQQRLAKIPILLQTLSAIRSRRSLLRPPNRRLAEENGTREASPQSMEAANDELPEGWKSCAVKASFRSFSGGTPNKGTAAYWGGKIPWLSSGDIKTDRIQSASETITKAGLENSSAKLCRNGSVVVVVRSGILKHTLPVAILNCEAAINQDIKCFDSGDNDLNIWLALAFRASAKDILALNREGTTVQSVKYETLKEFLLSIPPLTEQREIVRRVEGLFTLAEQIEARYAKAKAHVEKLTQSILAKAFRGELVPQDPNDEPASVLLERIKQQHHDREKGRDKVVESGKKWEKVIKPATFAHGNPRTRRRKVVG